MNLLAIRTEVLTHGFDPTQFSTARLNQYINDGYNLICRRTNYTVDESTQTFATAAGTASYALPATFARGRSLLDTDREVELEAVGLRDIDRSSVTQGTPNFYAFDGLNLHLYPTPDGVHNLLFRFWKMPTALSADGDIPTLPTDWHHILWVYACWVCYEAEDDAQQGQYWQQRFMAELAEFQADQRFPNSDFPTQVRGMWDASPSLSSGGWTLYGGG